MNTVKIPNKKATRIIAHRGLSGLETENTHSAFTAAGNRSYFGIETDVHKTADGQYVVIHDDDLKRVSGDDISVEGSTYDTLRGILLKEPDGKKGRTDMRIPSLSEYAEICKKYEKVSVLELKNAFAKEQIAEICECLKAAGQLEQTVFISFDFQNLVFLREILPEQTAQFLTCEFSDELLQRLKKYNLDLDILFKAMTADNIAACHAEGIEVNVWTVDSLADAERLIDYGVDYITTNILE